MEQTMANVGTVNNIELKVSAEAVASTAVVNISDKATYDEAGTFLKAVKSKADEVKSFFAPMKEQANKLHKSICEQEKSYLQPLVDAEKAVKKAMSDYLQMLEEQRRKQEELLRKLAEQEAERLADSGNIGEGVAMLDIAEQTHIDAEKVVSDGVSYTKDWDIEITDASKVPVNVAGVEIRPIDTAAIMRLVRASKGAVQIDGIKIIEKSKIIVRK